MASMDEFDARLTKVERQVADIRQDAATARQDADMAQQAAVVSRQDAQAARVLSRCVDRDVSNLSVKLDKQQTLLQALRETQVEQGQQLHQIDQRLNQVDHQLQQTDRDMRTGFGKMAIGQAEITSLLQSVIRGQSPDAR